GVVLIPAARSRSNLLYRNRWNQKQDFHLDRLAVFRCRPEAPLVERWLKHRQQAGEACSYYLKILEFASKVDQAMQHYIGRLWHHRGGRADSDGGEGSGDPGGCFIENVDTLLL